MISKTKYSWNFKHPFGQSITTYVKDPSPITPKVKSNPQRDAMNKAMNRAMKKGGSNGVGVGY